MRDNGMVTPKTEIRISRQLRHDCWDWDVEAYNGDELIMSTWHKGITSAEIEVGAWLSRIERAANEASK